MDAEIDALLERYLGLLDEYTELRASLGAVQSGMYQNIARANFAAERGMRYGPDCFDERMQASRRLSIQVKPSAGHESGGQHVSFAVCSTEESEPPVGSQDSDNDKGGKEPGSPEPMAEANQQSHDGVAGTNEATAKASPTTRKDPLRWFGLFTPTSLRLAQGQAIEIVEDLLPRIASVDAKMGQVEIQVRRAKKKRSKAATAAEKETRTAQQAEQS
ncbi:hypothetical protein GGTG_03711 [Gaeumannomyces tritici R3-111a-1]|uniref:Vacuolar ATPase assembly protein VMA22 n=1 Tax=Gaeumannomyces tritici (strain R3-111a-1) TaxID=644352 RepID=J3NR06_GAET3|nr:hypothetical protein GGTG_03711 [Gaeumannomyces tritici R3-111a-1]EJT78612.1 hypothetical protein GGTG_03711 [Gaeumannomyces tritici R3-111a-1]